jgi:penicillin amidase
VRTLTRALTYSITAVLAAFLLACYWFGWRPLGEVTGTISAPITAPATISRDSIGVPHIKAATWEDAVFVQGYAMAEDRLWQMDGLRRRAAGELSEVVGPIALPSDQEARSLGMARIVDAQEKNLSAEERAAFSAFARGVNHYIDQHRNRLPLEFSLLNYAPRPWRVRDSMLAGMEMYRTLTSTWRAEMNKQSLREHGELDKVEYLFPLRNGNDPQPGSNAWVVSGTHTASGKPILANDPHLEYALPSPWYLVHLQAPDLDVTGASIVGLPGVITGHNRNIAWGVTNLEFDVQDLYKEQFDPQTGRYQVTSSKNNVKDTFALARFEQDLIGVKGAPPVPYNTWVTRHGRLFINQSGQQYAVRWVPAEPGGFTFPFLQLDRAHNWQEFRAALSRYAGPGQNFVYADTEGHIGYQATGRLPRRTKCAGDVPSDGTNTDCEWAGFIPFDELPRAYDPPSGVWVTANQISFHTSKDYLINGNFAAPYRAHQIEARLASRHDWKAEEMLGVQRDVYSAFGVYLAQEIAAAYDRVKPQREGMRQAVDTLRHWDGQMEPRKAAPMIVMLVLAQLRKQALERAAPDMGTQLQENVPALSIERLLREKPAGWFPDYDQLMMRCLTGALEAGLKIQGFDASQWDWGRYQALTIASPVAGRIPLLGRFFNVGPFPMRGSPTTVAQYTGRLGPSMRIVVDLANLDGSLANLTLGESGQRLSPHYKDQWEAYYSGRSFPMQFDKVDAKQVLTVTPLTK